MLLFTTDECSNSHPPSFLCLPSVTQDSTRSGSTNSERGARSGKRKWRLGSSKSHNKESYSTSSLQRFTDSRSNDALDNKAPLQQQAANAEDQSLMRRSQSFTSMDSRPTSQVVGSTSQTRKVYSAMARRFIRGWLQLQQAKFKSSSDWKDCFCVLENLKMFCFTDEGCDELICSVPLRGARVSEASQVCECVCGRVLCPWMHVCVRICV